jgi:gamma-glutamyl-gamma-aminobutyrate hydrolase PuuD
MEKIKVLVVEDDNEASRVRQMFVKHDWGITKDINEADVICFVGGEDVDPVLYDEAQHRSSFLNKVRDAYETEIYNEALNLGIPMVGICRGGQFLNVMNGGKLWQDVDGHGRGSHNAFIPGDTTPYNITSSHHQMMVVNERAIHKILLTAGESHRRCRMSHIDSVPKYETVTYPNKAKNSDIEAVFYEDTRCLCFQPHPEYSGAVVTAELFFDFIDTYILGEIQFIPEEQDKEIVNA